MPEEQNVQSQPEQKFPSEIIDLPSGGKIYGQGSPLYQGKVEVKYMTAKEEDILTSTNLIKKGVALEKLLNSLILTPGVNVNDLVIGDKNAIMIAIRILAYGPKYPVEVTNPNNSDEKMKHEFNLTDCPFKELPKDVDYSKNEFKFKLPIAKKSVKFKLLTGIEEDSITRELESKKKLGSLIESSVTTRLKYIITEIDGKTDKMEIGEAVENMLSKDSLSLRQELQRVSPDIEMKQEVEFPGGDTVEVAIPLTVNFFWPEADG
tara:strand:- start:583 stop:1371 length:789 start_codon:yes stop_codon:yes gene_type:complete